jgi:sulfur relay (sulfurtransferase) DsrC/TusE family protein
MMSTTAGQQKPGLRQLERDEEGFLRNADHSGIPSSPMPLRQEAGVPLTPGRRKIVRYVRDYFEDNFAVPEARTVLKHMRGIWGRRQSYPQMPVHAFSGRLRAAGVQDRRHAQAHAGRSGVPDPPGACASGQAGYGRVRANPAWTHSGTCFQQRRVPARLTTHMVAVFRNPGGRPGAGKLCRDCVSSRHDVRSPRALHAVSRLPLLLNGRRLTGGRAVLQLY